MSIDSHDIVFRTATPADREPLRAMQALSFRVLGGPHYGPRVIDAFMAEVGTMDDHLLEDGTYLVALRHGRIVGSGGWSRRPPGYGRGASTHEVVEPLRATIRSVFVHPAVTRRGIASALMSRAEQGIAAAGFDRAVLTATLSGVSLYRALGFLDCEPVEIPLKGGLVFRGLTMHKPLPRPALTAAA